MRKRASPAWLGLGALAAAGVGYGLYRRAKAARELTDIRRLPLQDVDSSMIRQVGYRPETREMVVRFNTGRKYAYQDVPRSAYERLLEAESVGKHFNDKMRDRYDHEKIALRIPGFRFRAPKPAPATTGAAPTPSATGAPTSPQPNPTAPQPSTTPTQTVQTAPQNTPNQAPQPSPPAMEPAPQPTTTNNAGPTAQGTQPKPKTDTTPDVKPEAEQSSFFARNALAIGGGVAGAGVGAAMKGSDGRPLGVEGAMVGAMTGIGAGALLKSGLTAGNKVLPQAKEITKASSLLTGITSTAVGAGVGALTAGEGNRVQGALLGGTVGLAAGQAMRHIPSHTGSLADAATGKVTAPMQAKLKAQQASLDAQLKGVKGVFSRNSAIESFMKNPVNAELAQVYRAQQRAQLAGAAGGGLIGGAAAAYTTTTPDYSQQKSAALRAAQRFNARAAR